MPTKTVVERVVRTHAPMMTQQKLDEIREQVGKLTDPEQKDIATKLLKPVELWWELETSSKEPMTTLASNRVDKNGESKPFNIPVQPLDQEIKDKLEEAIPWMDEINTYEQKLMAIEAEANHRNGEKKEVWYEQLNDALFAELYPEFTKDGLRASMATLKTAKRVGVPLNLVEKLCKLLTGLSSAALQERKQKFHGKLQEALNGGATPVPKPAMEQMPQRNAMMMLVWYARELCVDREPITAEAYHAAIKA